MCFVLPWLTLARRVDVPVLTVIILCSCFSDSLESVNTRSSGQSRHNNRTRQGTPQSRQGTPQSRRGTPHSRHAAPHARHSVPHLRHGTPQRDAQKGFDDYATIFDVQQGLKKGQLVEVREKRIGPLSDWAPGDNHVNNHGHVRGIV